MDDLITNKKYDVFLNNKYVCELFSRIPTRKFGIKVELNSLTATFSLSSGMIEIQTGMSLKRA